MRTTLRFTVAALLLGAAGCSSASRDAENICTIAQEIEAHPPIDPALRAQELATRIGELDLTDETERAFSALAYAPANMRHRLLQQAFREQGVEGWTCPALERFWEPSE